MPPLISKLGALFLTYSGSCTILSYQEFFVTYFNTFSINTKLLNGLFLIHPYCIYVMYSLCILYVYRSFTAVYIGWDRRTYLTEYSVKVCQANVLSLLIIGVVAVVLGA